MGIPQSDAEEAGFFFTGVLLPFLSGLFYFWVGYEVIKQAGTSTSGVLVAMALGIPLMLIARKATLPRLAVMVSLRLSGPP